MSGRTRRTKKEDKITMKVALIVVGVILLGAGLAWITNSPTEGGDTKDSKVITTKSGLKYIDLKVGAGAVAKAGDKVVVHYTGTLKTGKKFDSSLDRDEPFSFQLGGGQVIKGWDEGVAGMQEGGKRKLIIPSDLGYGPKGRPPVIPPDAELHFEVELLKVQ
jgi:FKBP-type peptidyl-prolyl cis-trans isomerase